MANNLRDLFFLSSHKNIKKEINAYILPENVFITKSENSHYN